MSATSHSFRGLIVGSALCFHSQQSVQLRQKALVFLAASAAQQDFIEKVEQT